MGSNSGYDIYFVLRLFFLTYSIYWSLKQKPSKKTALHCSNILIIQDSLSSPRTHQSPKPCLFFWLKSVCQSTVIYGAADLRAG